VEVTIMVNGEFQALRDWQRARAGEQDKAVRTARRAIDRMARADHEKETALATFASCVAELERTGLGRDQIAAFVDVTPAEVVRLVAAGRRQPTATS
jgi:hypothetical protein